MFVTSPGHSLDLRPAGGALILASMSETAFEARA
jgi:hypothetical protein